MLVRDQAKESAHLFAQLEKEADFVSILVK